VWPFTGLQVLLYHGPKRALDPVELQEADVVLTTFNVIESEYRKNVLPSKKECQYCKKKYYPQQLKMHLTFWCG
jgi:DNA repair protein RAD16